MADLTFLQSGTPAIIVGADSTGNETNPMNVSTTGDAGVVDGTSGPGLFGNLSVPTANTAVEVKVGGSRLTNRKSVTLQPIDGDMYWGYTSSVTVSGATGGTLIRRESFTSFAFDPTAPTPQQVWVICATASKNARITEST